MSHGQKHEEDNCVISGVIQGAKKLKTSAKMNTLIHVQIRNGGKKFLDQILQLDSIVQAL